MRHYPILFLPLLLSACTTCNRAQVKPGATESERSITAGQCGLEAERLLDCNIPKTQSEDEAFHRRKDEIVGSCMESKGWRWIETCR